MRNDISHEYARDDFSTLIEGVVLYSPSVLEAISTLQGYVAIQFPGSTY